MKQIRKVMDTVYLRQLAVRALISANPAALAVSSCYLRSGFAWGTSMTPMYAAQKQSMYAAYCTQPMHAAYVQPRRSLGVRGHALEDLACTNHSSDNGGQARLS